MNRRGKRLTLAVISVGLAVVLGLAIAYRKPILEHVEAWHFQLTSETETIGPGQYERPWNNGFRRLGAGGIGRLHAFGDLANCSKLPVVFDATLRGSSTHWLQGELPYTPTADAVAVLLGSNGYRVLEQRFPRRAYVVIRDEHFDEVMKALTELGGCSVHSSDRDVQGLVDPSRQPLEIAPSSRGE